MTVVVYDFQRRNALEQPEQPLGSVHGISDVRFDRQRHSEAGGNRGPGAELILLRVFQRLPAMLENKAGGGAVGANRDGEKTALDAVEAVIGRIGRRRSASMGITCGADAEFLQPEAWRAGGSSPLHRFWHCAASTVATADFKRRRLTSSIGGRNGCGDISP
jgi:hypothetical protein